MSIPLRVLIIEDSEQDSRLLLRQLKEGGYEPKSRRVETANDLETALAEQEWDVIIADYLLPQFTGLDALKLVQARGWDTPFILVSGAIGEEQAVAVVKAGVQAFMLKDRLQQLALVVERELKDAEERRQRKCAEAALRESERRYSALFANKITALAECRIITDEQGQAVDYTIVRVNEAYEQLFGMKKANIEGRRVREIFPGIENFTTNYIGIFGRIAQEGSETKFEGYLEPTQQHLSIYAYSPLPGEFIAIIEDITDKKLIEQKLIDLNRELETRVIERTSELRAAVNALEAQIADRQRLESEVLKISEHEQSRIGQDLHDGACQNIACIAVLAEASARELAREKAQTAETLRQIAELARQSVDEVRQLASGLFPVKIKEEGLKWALEELASSASARSHSKCSLLIRQPMAFTDLEAAVQVYRIAQEAVSNAVRHGQAPSVTIELAMTDGRVRLTISDDGTGILKKPKAGGLGLHSMEYRARALGGSLEVRSEPGRGTTVDCSFPGENLVRLT